MRAYGPIKTRKAEVEYSEKKKRLNSFQNDKEVYLYIQCNLNKNQQNKTIEIGCRCMEANDLILTLDSVSQGKVPGIEVQRIKSSICVDLTHGPFSYCYVQCLVSLYELSTRKVCGTQSINIYLLIFIAGFSGESSPL